MVEKKSKLEEKLTYKTKLCWEIWDKKEKDQALKFAEGYKTFLSQIKTEREAVDFFEKLAKKNGYQEIDKVDRFKAQDKVYVTNRQKNIVLARRGKKSISEGVRMVLAHIDSPRLDLKVRPLYEDENIAFFKTHYYGGIKKYQWPTVPLALHGVVVLKNGKKVNLTVGEKEGDPIFMITDLLPHLAKKQLEKPLKDAIEAEELNIVVGSFPLVEEKEAREKVKLNILKILNERFGFSEEDFVSAEISAVPSGSARDVGFDQSLVAAYGHDDKICAYAAVMAILEAERTDYTSFVALVDREEVGSEGNTGAKSLFFYDCFGRLFTLELGAKKNAEVDYALRGILRESKALSGDVTAALDPQYKDVHDLRNNPRLGKGVVLERHTGAQGKYSTSEASAEYLAFMRELFEKEKVCWQPSGGMGKVDIGGGGTVAKFFANYNIDVVDCGPPLLNMHAPFEIASKADLFSTFQSYLAFLKG